MRIQTRRQKEKTERTIRLLREQLAATRAEALVQARANGRLAASVETAQAKLASNNAALTNSHREMAEQIDRLQKQVESLQRANAGLHTQLNHAPGADDADLALIAAGRTTTDPAS